MVVHLIDGTYELFRHFYGQRRFNKGKDAPFGAVVGVLHTVLQMIEKDATHIGVATDHVIESFRNALWPGYKTGEGIEPALFAQFHPLEQALAAMGVAVWPMIELEADDALASAARIAAADARVQRVCIWTPDKDLAQCVQGDRVVQVHRKIERRSSTPAACARNTASTRCASRTSSRWSATSPTAIPASTASARPAPRAWSTATARSRISRPRSSASAASRRCSSRSWLRCGPTRALFGDVDELRWRGPTEAFDGIRSHSLATSGC